MAAHGEPLGAKKRLDSWKEIAAFFGRDERTVKRWEKERGLPVYRVPGSARGGVFAYSEELAEWLKAPNHLEALESAPVEISGTAQDSDHAIAIVVAPVPAEIPAADIPAKAVSIARRPETEDSTPKVPALVASSSRIGASRIVLWVAPLLLIAGSLLVFSLSHRDQRFKNALAAPHRANPDAQDLYLRGRYFFEKRTPDDLNKAVDFFTQAIVNDPAYAAPYVGLADSYNLLREYSAMPPQEAFPRALAAARKAVEIDPNSAEAHNSLAFASFWGFFDSATADREFQRAIELNPNLSRAHHWYATFLIALRRDQDALTEIEKAQQLDPSSTPILADKAFILASAGKTEEARTLLMQIEASQPDFVPAHRYLAETVYFPEANYAGYLVEMATVANLRHDAKMQQTVEAERKAYERGGVHGFLEERLATRRTAFDHGNGSAFDLAAAYAALGHNSEALKYLEIAYKRHDLALSSLRGITDFQSMQNDPEFLEIAGRVGLEQVR